MAVMPLPSRHPLPELVSFLESLPEPHILCDSEYRILAANAAYRAQCGSQRDVVGRTCFEVSHRYTVPCDRAGETCPLARSLHSGQRERVVHLHHTPCGEKYEDIELSPIRNAKGEIAYFIEKLEPLHAARGLAHNDGLVGRAPAFRRMLELLARAAPSDAAVLLQGESGTGKELAARAIHEASPRADAPFVAVECSGLTESLFESELFGHEKGAFTGAAARKAGLVEAASGGTLFLDELGDVPATMQVKLLRFLETGTYRRVGSTELRKADLRVVSATHQPLQQMVAAGSFRRDLYYRLNAFPITLPPLRERREDIPLLAQTLLARVAPARTLRIGANAQRALSAYDYPGNIRELRNILERASLLCDADEIRLAHLPDELAHPQRPARIATGPVPPGTGGARRGSQPERDALRRIVHNHRGTRRQLAAELGCSERTLYRLLKELDAG